MPESKRRRKDTYTPPTRSSSGDVPAASPPWLVPVMLAMFIVGLLWIVVYYLAGNDLPLMSQLGNWNIVVGFGFIMAGFILSTKWR